MGKQVCSYFDGSLLTKELVSDRDAIDRANLVMDRKSLRDEVLPVDESKEF